ncbi:MAG: DUF2306 domain-containing protein [Pseudomonadota bacterium]
MSDAGQIQLAVLGYYIASLLWLGLAARAFVTKRWRTWVGLSVIFMLVLNLRFFLVGIPETLALNTSVADLTLYLFETTDQTSAGLTLCEENRCAHPGSSRLLHTLWAAEFYARFAGDQTSQAVLLYGHILGNSIAFVLVTIALLNPGLRRPSSGEGYPQPLPRRTNARNCLHKLLGRVSFISMVVGVLLGAALASQHYAVPAYGGLWSQWGLYSMSGFVFLTGLQGVKEIKRGNHAAHRIWMWRHAGALWGSFFVFRITINVLDPLFLDYPGVAWSAACWLGAPGGILIAEWFRRRQDAKFATPIKPVLSL